MWLCFSFNKLYEPNVRKCNIKIYQQEMKIWARLGFTVVELKPENLVSFMIKNGLKDIIRSTFRSHSKLVFVPLYLLSMTSPSVWLPYGLVVLQKKYSWDKLKNAVPTSPNPLWSYILIKIWFFNIKQSSRGWWGDV